MNELSNVKSKPDSRWALSLPFLSSFGIGLGDAKLIACLLLISIGFMVVRECRFKLTHSALLALIIASLYMLLVYGQMEMRHDSPYYGGESKVVIMLKIMTASLLAAVVVNMKPNVNSMINGVVFGLFIQALIPITYTAANSTSLTAYGSLMHPYGGNVNSPYYAIILGLSASYCINLLFVLRGYKVLLLFPLLALAIVFGVYLASRTFFVLLALSVLIGIALHLREGRILKKLSILISMVIICALIMLQLIELYKAHLDPILYSFHHITERVNQDGLESKRFDLLEDGLTKMLTQPFGGYNANMQIYGLPSFQNIYLDSARFGGILALILISALTIFPLLVNRTVNNSFRHFYVLLIIAANTETFLEANYQLMYVIMFVVVYVVGSKRRGLNAVLGDRSPSHKTKDLQNPLITRI